MALRAALLAALAALAAASSPAPLDADARRLDDQFTQCSAESSVPDAAALVQAQKCEGCSPSWAAARDMCHKAGGHRSWADSLRRAPVRNSDLEPLLQPGVCDKEDYGFDASSVGDREAEEAREWFKKHIAVYVVNLDKDRERWDLVSKRLAKLGIPFERIPGVDLTAKLAFKAARYQGLFPQNFNFTKAEQRFNNTRNGGGIIGTVGCAAAHLRAMRIVAGLQGESPRPMALILEDDVRLVDHFMVMLKRLLDGEVPCDWKAIALQSMCPHGACVSRHLTRVLPYGHDRSARCEAGVSLGFAGMLYRLDTLEEMRSRLSMAVWDDENPGCLDVDVAMASISDEVAYYAVPGAQADGLLDMVKVKSSRLAFNNNFDGWTSWSGGIQGGKRYRSRADEYWEVVSKKPVHVRQKSNHSDVMRVKEKAAVLHGKKEGKRVHLDSEPGFVRIVSKSNETLLRHAEPIYDFWDPANLDHTFHFGQPWLGEERGTVQFSVFPEPAEGTEPVYRFSLFYEGRLEYTFHFGKPREGEVRQGVEFHAFSYEAPGTKPVYEFWHPVNREHTLHMGDPWIGEEKREVQFWAYPPPPEQKGKAELESGNIRSCFTVNATYQPLMMMAQIEPGTVNATGCQELCKDTGGCRYFSFFPWDGTCHFAGVGAYIQNGSLGAISGPRSCHPHHHHETQQAGWVDANVRLMDVAHGVHGGSQGAGSHALAHRLIAGLGALSGLTALAAFALTFRRSSSRSEMYTRQLIATDEEPLDMEAATRVAK